MVFLEKGDFLFYFFKCVVRYLPASFKVKKIEDLITLLSLMLFSSSLKINYERNFFKKKKRDNRKMVQF